MPTKNYLATKNVGGRKEGVPYTKKCGRCGENKRTKDEFYKHRKYKAGFYLDDWCIDCVKAFCFDKESLEIYCKNNHREFNKKLWDISVPFVKERATAKEDYLKLSEEEKNKYLLAKTILRYLQTQSQGQHYSYVGAEGEVEEVEAEEEIKEFLTEFPSEAKIYSDFWDGMYTRNEIKKMDDELEKYKDTYELNPFDETNVILIIQTYIQVQRARRRMNNDDNSAMQDFQKLSGVYSKMSEDAQLHKKQRGLLEKGAGRAAFTQKVDDLEKLGAIPETGCNEKDELEKLLDCNYQMLLDIFVGAGYDERKYKQILGSKSKDIDEGDVETNESETNINTV